MPRKELDRQLIDTVRTTVRNGRDLVGWSQRELSRRSGVVQSLLSRIERGQVDDLRLSDVDRLLSALGIRYWLGVEPPTGFGRRRSDAVHARCSGFVHRRLGAGGWLIEREVEIGSDRSRGWIDILAFHADSGLLLVIEVKTELHDLGAIERSLNWYRREAWAAARRFGWRPTTVATALLVLQSVVNDARISADRAVFGAAFSGRATQLRGLIEGSADLRGLRNDSDGTGNDGFLAMIDPHSRRATWLRATTADGRRTAAPYADYIDALQRLERPASRQRRAGPRG